MTPALAERIATLERVEREEAERLRDEQQSEILRYLHATSFEELDHRYANYEQQAADLEDAWTIDEVERAHQRHRERRTLYMTELGIPQQKKVETRRPRKFIEDDDEIPELRSDDEDSDDEETNTSKHQSWRHAHNTATRSTTPTHSSAIMQYEAAPSQTQSESNKRPMETSRNCQPDSKLKRQPALHSAHTLHTADTQKSSSIQKPSYKTLYRN